VTLAELRTALDAGGYQLRANGEAVVVRGPRLTDALRAAIREHKVALLPRLTATHAPAWTLMRGRGRTPDGDGEIVQVFARQVGQVLPHLRVRLDGETRIRGYRPEDVTSLAGADRA
jgi:hypothetical protein